MFKLDFLVFTTADPINVPICEFTHHSLLESNYIQINVPIIVLTNTIQSNNSVVLL